MEKNKNLNPWSNRDFVNELIESKKDIKIVNQSNWKEVGLNRAPAATQLSINENNYEYFLNYYAIEVLKQKLNESWRIPTVADWQTLSEKEITNFKRELPGTLSPIGEKLKLAFSINFWTNDLQGSNYAFTAVLTNLNLNVYPRSVPLASGNLLRLIRCQ